MSLKKYILTIMLIINIVCIFQDEKIFSFFDFNTNNNIIKVENKNMDKQEDKLLAFPGAEGGGMYTKGARAAKNFEIYHVTNLNDSGEGSFREAVSKGNRIIIFDVSGTIMIDKEIVITSNNLTILGQTAPGEGVCIGGESVRFLECDNIIVRYMRFRMGDKSVSQEDSLGGNKCSNVIIDHCSVSWSIDECFSWFGNVNFTAQWNLISESLCNSVHEKGIHSYGGIWGGQNATFHHNLLATHYSRCPRIGTTETVLSNSDEDAVIDIRNNVVYNWGLCAGYGGENGVRVNLVNNYFKPTAFSMKKNFFVLYAGKKSFIPETDLQATTLHISGNVMRGLGGINDDNWLGVEIRRDKEFYWIKRENIDDVGIVMCSYEPTNIEVPNKIGLNNEYIYDYPVKTYVAEEAYNQVLEKCGASYVRDEIDKRVISDVENGNTYNGSKGSFGFIDSQEDVGGWCSLKGEKKIDTDKDGIPDEWEIRNKLDRTNPDDAIMINSSGYTNIESYANSLVENR